MHEYPRSRGVVEYVTCLVSDALQSLAATPILAARLLTSAERGHRPAPRWQPARRWTAALRRRLALGWCLVASALVALSVVVRFVSPLVLVVYLSAIVAGYLALRETPLARLGCWPTRSDWAILVPLILLQLAALQYFANLPFHDMQDEFITAYASYHLPSLAALDWFGAFPPKGQWVTQFPVLFFLLQKPILVLLGPSVEAVKVSTWPYDVLVVVVLYLLGRELFASQAVAAGVVVIYIALAPNLYVSSLAVHFISSTLFFLASFYFFVLLQRRRDQTFALLCGVAAALAYLTYTASYLTLPLLLAFLVVYSLTQRSLRPMRLFTPGLAIWGVAMLPFVVYAVTQVNYFTNRADQVNLLGTLKRQVARPGGAVAAWSTLSRQVATNVVSLYTAGPGGVTDFWFGHQAVFNPLTFGLLLLGIVAALVSAFVGKRRELFFLVVVVGATFVFGMVLTLPPGAFHRTSLAFPFVALLIALGIQIIGRGLDALAGNGRLSRGFLALAVAVVVVANVQSALVMVQADQRVSSQKDDDYVAQYLIANFPPGTKVSIAAEPSYHLGRELFFRAGDRYDVTTGYFAQVFGQLGAGPLIVLDPSLQQRNALSLRYPQGKLVDQIDGHNLKHLIIFLPRSSPA